MDTIARSDAFFVITSVAIIILSVLFSVLLVYGIRVIRDVSQIAKKARQEGEAIIDDVRAARENIKTGSSLRSFGTFLARIFANSYSGHEKTKRRSTKNSRENQRENQRADNAENSD